MHFPELSTFSSLHHSYAQVYQEKGARGVSYQRLTSQGPIHLPFLNFFHVGFTISYLRWMYLEVLKSTELSRHRI